MATSKKTGPAKGKSSKSETVDAIEDAVIVEDTATSPADAEVTKPEDTAEALANDTVPAVDEEESLTPDEKKPETPPETYLDASDDEPLDAQTETHDTSSTAQMVHPVPAVAQSEKKDSIFLPLVLGGIVAGALGFFAGQADLFGDGDSGITTKLRSDLSAQQERLATLEAAEQPVTDLSPLETQLSDLETRLAALEDRPAPVASEGGNSQAYAAELKELQSSIATQRNEIQALLNNAKSVEEATADAARAASAQAAISKIVSAIDAGQPFAGPIEDLQSLDLGEIDPALTASAADGVASLSALQAEFPDQARTALATARASGAEEGQQGFGSFLKRSLGARSVAPREGNDPDAILSRAEAAIRKGDLTATLSELDTLPEEAQAAIADWRAAADARVSAQAAAEALSQRLTAD
ncbi:hypothetical protein GGR95_001813 [Sulfitobacter undariae]|uniref:Inner membrane protein n=1 Tax=Sulfitobacter undariae TaxID=1563671 RepID=A0A7W6H0K6_9RHOB|nr:hypothetical protein [Sulfitobacter undariae]